MFPTGAMSTMSLVIPLHQGERFIAEAIGSVLAQEEPPHELIVVDDGSTDRGPEIAAAIPEVSLLRQENHGPGAARNRGVAASTGELIAFLDQDDLLRPAALRRHREALEGDPAAMISVGRQRFDLLEGEPRPPWQRPELLGEEIVAWTPSAICVRRTIFEAAGMFDESLQATSDLLWFQRVRSSGVRAVELDETLVDRRVHAGCQSADASTIRREMLEVFRRAAAKRERGA
jgi:glycosyltransferase involved in cell wall biosynthesis